MNTLTIIGGSGFVGKSFIDSFNRGLLKKSLISKVNIICRNKFKTKHNKNFHLKNIKILYQNICNMKKLPESDLYIYAAETTKIIDYKNVKKITKDHKTAINNFCKLIKDHPKSKVLYLSSGAVEKKYQNNLSKTYKKTYSLLKLYSENKIKLLKKNKICSSIARCYTFIGPMLPINEHFAVGNFLRDAKYKKQIIVKSRNLVFRSFMYADDMVDWLSTILNNAKITTKTYNVGSDEKVEIRKLASIVASFSKKKIKIVSKNLNSNYIDKYLPNVNKTKNDFKLKINYSLKKAIRFTFQSI